MKIFPSNINIFPGIIIYLFILFIFQFFISRISLIFDLKCIFYWLANVAYRPAAHTCHSLNGRFIWQLPRSASNWKWRQKGALRMQFLFLYFAERVCVCIFYARLRFCMQINQRRPVTCRIWALAEASARVRRGGRFGDGRNWRLKAGCSAQKHISHYLSH